MNNKGFTLIEILAAITILGILMLIAVPAVYKYTNLSKQKSFDTLVESLYQATTNKAIDDDLNLENCSTFNPSSINYTSCPSNSYKVYQIENLKEENYLKNIKDPANPKNNCVGKTIIIKKKDATETSLDSYFYIVDVTCNNKYKTKKVFGSD